MLMLTLNTLWDQKGRLKMFCFYFLCRLLANVSVGAQAEQGGKAELLSTTTTDCLI